jgi:hypothetical protein
MKQFTHWVSAGVAVNDEKKWMMLIWLPREKLKALERYKRMTSK